MHIQIDEGGAGYRIHSYFRGKSIVVNAQTYAHSIIITPDHLEGWPPQSMEELQPMHLTAFRHLKPACIILGSGVQFQFPEPGLLAPFIEAGVGVEVMDTGAACRTYNVLMAERRKVMAALLLE